MSGFEAAVRLLPGEVRRAAERLPGSVCAAAQEFRLRLGRVPSVTTPEGELRMNGAPPVTSRDLARLVEIAGGASPYSTASAIRCGYLTAGQGVRIGLCGRMRPGAEETLTKDALTSAAIRIPREIRGCGERFCSSDFVSTLIVSPPGAGKTTLLRDMVRLLSDGGKRVALCDERGEVAAFGPDGFGFDVGERTDVLTDRVKHDSALQLLRTMNPEILAMDEITDPRDAAACRMAAGCGVALLATAHGGSGISGNSGLCQSLLRDHVFVRRISIRKTPGGREYREERLE